MSKPNLRKITADPTKCNTDSSRRPSVFERLGTKPAIAATAAQNTSDYCRNWALNGSCSYGKNCKYANTHTLISPSKRAKKDNAIASTSGLIEDPFKRLTSKIVKKASHSPDLNIEEWNQTDLEYEDEKVLERRRQLLQRELELQMKKDKEVHGKDKVRQKKKAMSSSSSSRTSSTSSSSSSSSSEDSSSTSTSDSRKKVKKIKTKRHHSASTDYDEDKEKKRKLKLKRLGAKNDKAVSKKKRKLENNSTKKDLATRSIKKHASLSVSRKHSGSLRTRSPAMQGSTSGITSTSAVVLGSSVSVAHHASSSGKLRERNRSESPKAMKSNREMDKEDSRHYKKVRDIEECLSKDTSKCKSFDKIKEQQDKEKSRGNDEKIKSDDRLRSKCKDKDVRSRTPPPPLSSERSAKHQHIKESISSKTRRSRTPDKTPSRVRRDLTPIKNPEKRGSSSSRARDAEKKERDSHKRDKSKEREDAKKGEQTSSNKAKQTTSQDENYRRNNASKDNFDEKTYGGDKTRQKSRERQREKDIREERHSRLTRDQRQEPQRDKDKDESQERCRERQRERDRDRDRERERERDRDRDRDRERERERDREREREREIRERDRDREREREKSMKPRERDVSTVVSSTTLNLPADKSSRYNSRLKERPLSKDVPFEKSSGVRERSRSERERERSETKALVERERNSTQSRLDGRYERSGAVDKDASLSRNKSNMNSPRDRMDRFRETSLDRAPLHDKGGHSVTSSSVQSTPLPLVATTSSSAIVTSAPPSSRDHLMDMVDNHYDRDRHGRRFGMRYERGHTSEHNSRKDQTRIEPNRIPSKIDRIVDRRDMTSPRRAVEVDRNFGRNYGRMPEHWDEQEEPALHVEYRDHTHIHDDDRRKAVEGRRYDSPFEERRVAREERSKESRYMIQTTERTSFDDHRHHHHHHRHPLYTGDKLRNSGAGIRDETVSNDDWEGHHRDVEHGRDRNYPAAEWEEREWRTRTLWEDRDSLPRSEIHDDEWNNTRYDNSMTDWKSNDSRKWDNQNVHIRTHYRNERSKDLELGESTQHNKRRSYNAPEVREEPTIHPSAKQAAIYGSMKEEPINKKLMELAEGKLCTTTREKPTDSFQKKNSQKDKPEIKEPVMTEPKRPIVDDSLQTLHTESDLSDISDDPDDILNMEEDTTDMESSKTRTNKKIPDTAHRDAQSTAQEPAQLSPKESVEETIFNSKPKDNADTISLKNIEDENMETMDFEEISDGELEEDIKTSGKGLGDALGVDWESLVKETQARRIVSSNQDSAENRWQCKAIFYRIGISKKYAGEDFVKKLLRKYEKNEFLLADIALMHTALARNRLLQDLGNGAMHTVDDSLYRNNNVNYDEDVDYDLETIKSSAALYEEAKCLLQQVV
ncbi:zinc finger CCCH domain-containing protein 13 [Camponotus floridanus]|uniref:zinc finger CCCH domain-containing protein 13 n=1 Tax=Camponotus floridanus TaxID=104421 RepID=UPI00059BBCEC|nr:zinc finger CCCH domain-containing protein 13 [Camponotus floridanus]